MLILGLSAFRHHPAAALLQDGVIKAAIENDKLLRSNSHGLPEAAIGFCLEAAGVNWSDLDTIAVATRPLEGWLRRSFIRAKLATKAPLASAYYEANEIGTLARELNQMRLLRRKSRASGKIVTFDHHLCHAASGFFLSPFERALILTADEDGDGNSGMIAIGEGTRIRVLKHIPFPNSMAWVYSEISNLIGFRGRRGEHKTQWLSLEGDPRIKGVFLEMLRNSRMPLPKLDYRFINHGFAKSFTFSTEFYRRAGLPLEPENLDEDQRKALASGVQEACAELLTELIEYLRRREGITQVCLSGGLFQNTLLVASLEKKLGLNQLFVPPAPGNAGTAVGAAQVAWHQRLKKPRTEAVFHVYWGPKFNAQQAKDVLDNSKARYCLQTTVDRKLDATIQLLRAGRIVGWYQGACEFGPRALGNRSVLASPWAPYVKENLNDYIKFREWFRPFAISVPEEDCHKYFNCSQLCRFMNSLGWVRAGNQCLPEGFLLPGNRVRLHVVERRSNPLFWSLLKRFGEQAPAPMLVNTSFNLFGEPLVVTPRDAIRSYFCSGMDALVIDKFVLSKSKIDPLGKPALQGKVEVSV